MTGQTPPWLHLLEPDQKAWREGQIATGQDPDSFLEKHLVKIGKWPAKDATSDDLRVLKASGAPPRDQQH